LHPVGELLTEFTATVELDSFADIREAMFNPNLSRTFDTRSYEEGNIRQGIVSISHGTVHRARRRVENTQFRPDILRQYERDLFPKILDEVLDVLLAGESVDIFPVVEMLSSILAAKRAGLDTDHHDIHQLESLASYVDAFSQGSAILDARDPEAVRQLVYTAYENFEKEWIAPARARREPLIARYRAGEITEDELPHDILTVLLLHQSDPKLELDDDRRLMREVATYLQGGTHTAAQTVTNALDLMFEAQANGSIPDAIQRCGDSLLYSQKVVHETLRLRPTTPKIRRRAEADTVVAGRQVPKDAVVVLDAYAGNRDTTVFGPSAAEFNPDREIDQAVPRWGLSFGAGAHQCPGRSVGGGFPVPTGEPDDEHVYGLVALEIQAICARGVRPDPDHAPERDDRTDRVTRWSHYYVQFDEVATRA